jgi:hypothetical protein
MRLPRLLGSRIAKVKIVGGMVITELCLIPQIGGWNYQNRQRRMNNMIIKYPSKVYELMTDDCNILSASPSDEDYLNYANMILEINDE